MWSGNIHLDRFLLDVNKDPASLLSPEKIGYFQGCSSGLYYPHQIEDDPVLLGIRARYEASGLGTVTVSYRYYGAHYVEIGRCTYPLLDISFVSDLLLS